jgi:hypothetical protein
VRGPPRARLGEGSRAVAGGKRYEGGKAEPRRLVGPPGPLRRPGKVKVAGPCLVRDGLLFHPEAPCFLRPAASPERPDCYRRWFRNGTPVVAVPRWNRLVARGGPPCPRRNRRAGTPPPRSSAARSWCRTCRCSCSTRRPALSRWSWGWGCSRWAGTYRVCRAARARSMSSGVLYRCGASRSAPAPGVGGAAQGVAGPEAVERTGDLKAVAVRDAGLQVGQRDKVLAGPLVPEGQGQDAHQGAVAVASLMGRPGLQGRHAGPEVAQGGGGGREGKRGCGGVP